MHWDYVDPGGGVRDDRVAHLTPRAWYWAAIDAGTGKEAWRKLAGTGVAFNNNYAGLAIRRNTTAYVGTFGGLQALRDR